MHAIRFRTCAGWPSATIIVIATTAATIVTAAATRRMARAAPPGLESAITNGETRSMAAKPCLFPDVPRKKQMRAVMNTGQKKQKSIEHRCVCQCACRACVGLHNTHGWCCAAIRGAEQYSHAGPLEVRHNF
jgi:hypothetical protein